MLLPLPQLRYFGPADVTLLPVSYCYFMVHSYFSKQECIRFAAQTKEQKHEKTSG